jgi:hypothetical protein
LIKEVLDSHGLQLFADQKGDFMTFWGYEPEVDTEVKIWFKLDGEDEDVYRICATGDRPLPRKAWNRATRLCNDWNNEHRWPKASVLKLKRENRSVAFVELNADIPVRHAPLAGCWTTSRVASCMGRLSSSGGSMNSAGQLRPRQ